MSVVADRSYGMKKLSLTRQLTEARTRPELAAVTVRNVGREVVVEAGARRWNAQSGQHLLNFGAPPGRGSPWLRPVPSADAQALFAQAVAQETSDAGEAMRTYAQTVATDPWHADAHVNMGRLLHQRGDLREAEAHYTAALVARPADVTATFNLGVVLEDSGRDDEAIARYLEAVELEPELSDAYFNLSRLYEKKGEKLAALRHLKDYRRLSR